MKFPPNGFQIARITLLVRVVSNKNALYPYLSARSPAPGVPGCGLALKLRPFLRSGCSDSAMMAATADPALSLATQEQLKWQRAAE